MPLGFVGTAWDTANAVLFLSSDEARDITGVELPVDGGTLAVAGSLCAAVRRAAAGWCQTNSRMSYVGQITARGLRPNDHS